MGHFLKPGLWPTGLDTTVGRGWSSESQQGHLNFHYITYLSVTLGKSFNICRFVFEKNGSMHGVYELSFHE